MSELSSFIICGHSLAVDTGIHQKLRKALCRINQLTFESTVVIFFFSVHSITVRSDSKVRKENALRRLLMCKQTSSPAGQCVIAQAGWWQRPIDTAVPAILAGSPG